MATILVIDDEMGIRELLSEILDDEGHEVVLASNAAEGNTAYLKHAPDLVLLDIWMPDSDGMSLLREWVSKKSLRCPVIMMSGHASIETAAEAQDLGASDFLEKPITLHKLLSSVHKCLSRASQAKPGLSQGLVTEIMQPVVLEGTNTLSSPNIAPSPRIEPGTSASTGIATVLTPEQTLAQGNVNRVDSAVNAGASELPTAPSLVPSPVPSLAPLSALSVWQDRLSQINLDAPLRDVRDDLERIYFTYLLQRERWAMTRVAEVCGLERTHLYRKLKALNIEISRANKPL